MPRAAGCVSRGVLLRGALVNLQGCAVSVTEQNIRDLMGADARTGTAGIVGQDDDGTLRVEEADDVVVIRAEAAAVRDVAFALKDVGHPAESRNTLMCR